MGKYLDWYLQQLKEATKWKEKLAAGQLSKGNQKRIKKAGVSKPYKQYVKGFNKGTTNILKKYGSSIKYRKPADIGGPTVGPGKEGPVVLMPGKKMQRPWIKRSGLKMSRKEYEGSIPFVKRHETDELRTILGAAKKHGVSPAEYGLGIASHRGSHASPRVLKYEKPYRSMANFYGKAKWITKARKASGEEKQDVSRKTIRKAEKNRAVIGKKIGGLYKKMTAI